MDRNELMNRIQTSGQPKTYRSERLDNDEISLTAKEMRAFVFSFYARRVGVCREQINQAEKRENCENVLTVEAHTLD